MILFINGCVRPDSRTRVLAQRALDRIGGEVEEVNLEKENIQPLNLETLQTRDALLKEGAFGVPMLRYARQFARADVIVIAAPYWDLSFPAMVKNYFEATTVQGVTFYYTEEGVPRGLCKAKKVIYVMTAGGPVGEANFGFDYVKGVCRLLYGIEDVSCYKAEMLDVEGIDADAILRKAMEEIDAGLCL